jgi:hypothetical protein
VTTSRTDTAAAGTSPKDQVLVAVLRCVTIDCSDSRRLALFWAAALGLGLLALAAFVVLTNTVALVITLAILGTIVLLLGRSALAEVRKMSGGG